MGPPDDRHSHDAASGDGREPSQQAPSTLPADPAPSWGWPGGEVTPAPRPEDPVEGPSFWDWEPSGSSAEPGDPGTGSSLEAPGDPWDTGGHADAFAQAGAAPSAPRELGAAPRELVISAVGEEAGPPREGIGRRAGGLAHLSSDPRMRAWQRRVIIAIIVGVVFWIVVSWQLGLTLAVLAAIADTIYRSRTVFNGPPGARLTAAQRRTRSQLAKLERAGYHAMHCSLIPDSEDQIDHLVVGPAGVFAIDSEAWDKRLVVRTRNARQLWHGPYSMKDRLEHARWESERAAELISGAVGSPVSVRPAMAVYGPKIPWDVATIRDVDVFSGPRLRKYLRRRARESDMQPLSEGEAERIFKAARTAFPHPDSGLAVG